MKCPRCGKIPPPGVAACPNCGTPLGHPSPTQSVVMPAAAASLSQAYDAQKRKNTTAAIIAGVITLLAIILFGVVKGFGALGLGGQRDDTVALSAHGKLPDLNILSASGKPMEPVLSKPAPDQEKMPQDVLDWLRHLEKCEALKVEIAGDQSAEMTVFMTKSSVLGAGIGMMDPYDQTDPDNKDQDPATYTKGKMMDLRPQWEQLIEYFHSVPPPEECQPIANDYDRALNEIPAMMGDLGDILNGAMANPQDAMEKVKKMQNGSYGDIDRYFARTDQKVGQICAKYNVNKWFNIKTDVASGGMLGAPGTGAGSLPGMGAGFPGL